MSKRGEVRRRAGIGNGMKATDDEKGNNRRKSTGVKEKTEPSRIPKRGKATVPCTWRTADLTKNIKDLETKIQNQKTYLNLQEETVKRNDELNQTVRGMKQEPATVLNQYKEEVGTLGAETGGYETEIRYYKALGETSEVSSKMAEEAYSGQFKYSKSLQKTLSILQDKTAKLHDHQEVAELKEAIKSLHEARDREGYLIEKLTWYQDKVQQCTKPKIETDVENEAENTNLPSDEDAKLKALAKGDFTGNNLGILPSIKETNGISTESSDKIKQRPLPPTAIKYDEKYPRTKTARGRLPPINTPGSANEGIPVHPPVSRIDSLLKSQKQSEEKSTIPYDDDITSLLKSRKVPKEKAAREKVKVPRLDLSLLRRGNEQEEDKARKTTKLPSININQKVTELKHVPKPPKGSPKTPTLVRKIRSFLGWK